MTVMVRVRPSAPCERERAAHPILRVVDQNILIFNPEEPSGPSGSVLPTRGPKHQGKDLKFVFDRVFGERATQEEVFQHTTHNVLDSVLNGYNCSGKSQQAPSILAGAPASFLPGWVGSAEPWFYFGSPQADGERGTQQQCKKIKP